MIDTVNLLCLLLILALLGRGLHTAVRGGGRFAPVVTAEPLLRGGARLGLYALALALAALRLLAFGRIPGGFNQDGAMAAVDALALAHYGTDRFGTWLPAHFTAWGFGQMSVLMSYLMVPFLRLFGLTPVTARLPMLLASLAGMAALWALLRGMFDETTAYVGLLFTAVNPWHFMQSRWALDCNLFPHMFVIALALLWRGRKRPGALYGSMLFFALCMYSYGVAFTMVPLFLLGACALLLGEKRLGPGRALLCAALYLALSFPIYGTMLINALGLDSVELPFVTMSAFPDSVRGGDILFFSDRPLEQLALNAFALWHTAFLQTADAPWNDIAGFGSLYRCSLPLVLLGLALVLAGSLRREEGADRRLACRLLLLYWLCCLFTGLCVRQVNINRINIIFPAHIIFFTLGVRFLIFRLPRAAWGLAACYGLLAALFFTSYFGPWAADIRTVFFGDYLEAVEYAGELDSARCYITPYVRSDDYSPQCCEILTLFALDVDARYYQGKTDSFRGRDIPYRERFVYREPAAAELAAAGGDTVCVLRRAALAAYPEGGFEIVEFGDYCVLLCPDR